MRDLTLNKWFLAALVLLMPWVAYGAGLGKLTVLSALGQPFSAEIELVAVSQQDYSSLTAQLASADAYRQANLQYIGATADLRLSVERRPNGQPVVRITSARPITEPFLDLLVELNWSSGRVVREYTALLDPPGYGAAPPPPAPAAVVPTQPAPIAQPPAPPRAPAVSRPIVPAGDYGPIQRGETMGKIAAAVKPEGVTLEQMLMALFRSNPDAFIRKNVNLVKAGHILRVPTTEEVAAIPHSEAVKEFRAQVADWNAYRQRLAEAAGTARETQTAARGKIAARVETPAGDEPKDVVRLSKGEPPGMAPGTSKPASAAERVRSLEEEAVAREQALADAKDRISQLERTIKDMQRLAEIKNPTLAAAQKQAELMLGPKPDEVPASKPAPAAKMDEPEAAPAGQPATIPADQPNAAQGAVAELPKPTPQPKVEKVPPAPAAPDLMGTMMDNLPLVAGGGVVALGALFFGLARRRNKRAAAYNELEGVAPTLGGFDALSGEPAAGGAQTAKSAVDEVDPLAEAEVYVAYGRDAQAEEILMEAMAKEPTRHDIQLKLLEIYSARKDQSAFAGLAQDFRRLTGGEGDSWTKAAAMGYLLDPDNALYAAGREMAASMPPGARAADFQFDLGAAGSPPTDVTFDQGAVVEPEVRTVVEPTVRRVASEQVEREAAKQPDLLLDTQKPGTTTTDISFDLPEPGAPMATDIPLDSEQAAKAAGLDFDIELPKIDAPAEQPASGEARDQQKNAGSGKDFKLELGDINLDLDDQRKLHAVPTSLDRSKDTQWYDVQTKFDLAKAYQEMGDQDGAKEILQEVITEGDEEQRAEAKKLLGSLA